MSVPDDIRVAVVGVGGWGKNLARNYSQLPGCTLRFICDLDEQRLAQMAPLVPDAEPTRDFEVVLASDEVDAVVLATGAPTHYEMCARVLNAGKDLYVEKPFVLEVNHAKELVRLAQERERVLMVGHLLEYHPVVETLKALIDSGELGRVLYIYNQRLNLGTVREDENALWSLAPHDVSVVLYLLGREPTDVSARGQAYLREGVEDVVFMTLDFGGEAMAHIHVSWLDPHKVRRMTIVGEKKMAVFDDLETNEKLRIYDKGAARNVDYDSFAEYVTLRFGDINIPYIKVGEPLRIECEHFLDCVRTRRSPRSDGHDGLRVTRVLTAAQESIGANGQPVPFHEPDAAHGSP